MDLDRCRCTRLRRHILVGAKGQLASGDEFGRWQAEILNCFAIPYFDTRISSIR